MNDLELALAAATTGAAIVRSGFGAQVTTKKKGSVNPVTEVDMASEEAIVDLLTEHRPDDGLLGEEGALRESSGRRWIIDPLDGTVNFIHGLPHVAVSVALYDGLSPVLGVVVDVIRNEVFAAETGGGATRDSRRIRVSETQDLQDALIATGFPYDRDQHAEAYVRSVTAVLARTRGLRRIGSAALDMTWVACGRFDAYWEFSLGPWDAAAAVLIAAEAGAIVTDGRGAPYTIDSPHVVVANPHLHAPFQAIIEPEIPDHVG
jgi:myo-inositol-1(or 4)-monophosphatase